MRSSKTLVALSNVSPHIYHIFPVCQAATGSHIIKKFIINRNNQLDGNLARPGRYVWLRAVLDQFNLCQNYTWFKIPPRVYPLDLSSDLPFSFFLFFFFPFFLGKYKTHWINQLGLPSLPSLLSVNHMDHALIQT